MRKSRLVGVGALVVAVCSGPSLHGLSPEPGAQRGNPPLSGRPERQAAERHDTSRALRDMPPVAPARRTDPDEREPRGTRRIVRGRGRPDPVVQRSAGGARASALSQTVDGVGNVNAVLPPDTNAAVGPNHYVHSVNVSFAIYTKGALASGATVDEIRDVLVHLTAYCGTPAGRQAFRAVHEALLSVGALPEA